MDPKVREAEIILAQYQATDGVVEGDAAKFANRVRPLVEAAQVLAVRILAETPPDELKVGDRVRVYMPDEGYYDEGVLTAPRDDLPTEAEPPFEGEWEIVFGFKVEFQGHGREGVYGFISSQAYYVGDEIAVHRCMLDDPVQSVRLIHEVPEREYVED